MSTKNNTPGGEVLVYEAADGSARVDVRLEQETVWLTQRQMADLFDTTPENVLMHMKNIFGDGGLEEAATAKDFLVVRIEDKRQVRRNLRGLMQHLLWHNTQRPHWSLKMKAPGTFIQDRFAHTAQYVCSGYRRCHNSLEMSHELTR